MDSPVPMDWQTTSDYLEHGSNKRKRDENPAVDVRVVVEMENGVRGTLFDRIGNSIKNFILYYSGYRRLQAATRAARTLARDAAESIAEEIGAKRRRVAVMPGTYPQSPSPARVRPARPLLFNPIAPINYAPPTQDLSSNNNVAAETVVPTAATTSSPSPARVRSARPLPFNPIAPINYAPPTQDLSSNNNDVATQIVVPTAETTSSPPPAPLPAPRPQTPDRQAAQAARAARLGYPAPGPDESPFFPESMASASIERLLRGAEAAFNLIAPPAFNRPDPKTPCPAPRRRPQRSSGITAFDPADTSPPPRRRRTPPPRQAFSPDVLRVDDSNLDILACYRSRVRQEQKHVSVAATPPVRASHLSPIRYWLAKPDALPPYIPAATTHISQGVNDDAANLQLAVELACAVSGDSDEMSPRGGSPAARGTLGSVCKQVIDRQSDDTSPRGSSPAAGGAIGSGFSKAISRHSDDTSPHGGSPAAGGAIGSGAMEQSDDTSPHGGFAAAGGAIGSGAMERSDDTSPHGGITAAGGAIGSGSMPAIDHSFDDTSLLGDSPVARRAIGIEAIVAATPVQFQYGEQAAYLSSDAISTPDDRSEAIESGVNVVTSPVKIQHGAQTTGGTHDGTNSHGVSPNVGGGFGSAVTDVPHTPIVVTPVHFQHGVQAIDEDLSFLSDAPPARHVHWIESEWHPNPRPSRYLFYNRDEPIGYPLLSPNFRTIQPRAMASPAESEITTPGTVSKFPGGMYLSPATVVARTETDEFDDVRSDFELFDLSTNAQQKRRKQEQRQWQLAENKAAAEAVAKKRKQELLAEEKRKEELARGSIVKALSSEWNCKVDKAMSVKSATAELTASGLTRKDLGTILPQGVADGNSTTQGWLNDEAVNNYIDSMVKRGLEKSGYKKTADCVPKFHAFNTHLYPTYRDKGGLKAVERWFLRAKINGRRLLQVEKLFIPINTGAHWVLIVIHGTRRRVQFFDSLSSCGGQPSGYTRFALDLLAGTLGKDFERGDWTVEDARSVQQTNSKDCGVFVCMNALAVMKGRIPERSFTAEEMPLARRLVVATLINGGCTGEFEL